MKKHITRSLSLITNFKKTSVFVTLILVGGAWYYVSSSSATATTYVIRPLSTNTIRSVVSGTGQVQSSQQITITPKVSGDVLSVQVKNGDTVHGGDLLVSLDAKTAGFSLENAKISLAKLESSNPVSLGSAQNGYENAGDSLTQAYSNSFNTVVNTYSDMGSITTSLNDIFYTKDTSPYFYDPTTLGQTYGSFAYQYKLDAGRKLDTATLEYSNFRSVYTTLSPNSTSTLLLALNQEYNVAQDLLDTVKSTSVAINYIYNLTSKTSRTNAMNGDVSNLSTWITTMNKDTAAILSAIQSIQNNGRSLTQAGANLTSVISGTTPLDIQSAQLSLAQAQYTYDQYFIRAPFDGIVGNVSLHIGDSVGQSTTIATLVTKNYISKISLNEVDAAKVSVGQAVKVSFNALPDLSLDGVVSDVDSVGTVSQGVVSYTVVISFNTDDTRVKAGMSINADIITSEKDSVLAVPNGAIKTVGNHSFVQIPAVGVPVSVNGRVSSVSKITSVPVEIGLSDDTNTEIVSGLNQGDQVVIRTIAGNSTKTTTASQGNILSSLSGGRGGIGGGGGGARTGSTGATGRGN
jgi:HlyD family secretion protein